MKKIIRCMLGMFLLGAVSVQAAPPTITQQVTPGTMSYQGRLQTSDGTDYVNEIYTVDFKLYDAASGGEFLWGATYKPYVNNGFFSVILGQTDVGEVAISDATYPVVEDFWKGVWIDPNGASKQRYLGITVHEGADNQILASSSESFPRQQLLASPFAIQAQFAQQAAEADHAAKADGADHAAKADGAELDFTVPRTLDVERVQRSDGGSSHLTLSSTSGYIQTMDTLACKGNLWAQQQLIMGNHYIDHAVEAPQAKMRIITGLVDGDGSIERGSGQGWSSKRSSEGVYSITLPSGCSSLISVVASPTQTSLHLSAGTDNFVFAKGFSSSGFVVETYDNKGADTGNTVQNSPFNFIAIYLEN